MKPLSRPFCPNHHQLLRFCYSACLEATHTCLHFNHIAIFWLQGAAIIAPHSGSAPAAAPSVHSAKPDALSRLCSSRMLSSDKPGAACPSPNWYLLKPVCSHSPSPLDVTAPLLQPLSLFNLELKGDPFPDRHKQSCRPDLPNEGTSSPKSHFSGQPKELRLCRPTVVDLPPNSASYFLCPKRLRAQMPQGAAPPHRNEKGVREMGAPPPRVSKAERIFLHLPFCS